MSLKEPQSAKTTLNLVAYTRRSTDKQVASPQTQEHHIRDFAAKHGHQILRVYHEQVISRKAEIERRTVLPQLVAEIKDRKRDFDGIIVWRTDRLFGNTAEFHRLLGILDKNKCQIISIMDPVRRETAADRFMTNVMADAAAYERELVSERVYAHHIASFLQGKWPGGRAAMGLRWDGTEGKFVVTDRITDVETVFRTYLELNGRSKQTIKTLNDMGLPSPSGGLWSGTGVLSVLRGPMYRQKLVYSGHEMDAKHLIPPTIPEELLAQVDTLLKVSKERAFHPRTVASKRAYSGLMHCSVCGAVLTSGGRETEFRDYKNWQCADRRAFRVCDSRQLADSYINMLTGRALQLLLQRVRDPLKTRVANRQQDTRRARSRQSTRDKLTAEREKTVNLYVKSYIEESDFFERVSAIDAQLKNLDAEPATAAPLVSDEVMAAIGTMAEDWVFVPESEKRALLLQLQAHIVVNTSGVSPVWLELRTVLNPDPIRVAGVLRGRWGVRLLD